MQIFELLPDCKNKNQKFRIMFRRGFSRSIGNSRNFWATPNLGQHSVKETFFLLHHMLVESIQAPEGIKGDLLLVMFRPLWLSYIRSALGRLGAVTYMQMKIL